MLRVLVVEDEPAIADNLLYALRTDCFTVVHALTGGEAWNAFSDGPFDFVILDIGLPDMTGLELCRKIRETSEVPILFLTARDGEIDRILGLELGGDDYVTKPFSPREVVARVRAILRRASQPKEQKAPATPAKDSLLIHDEDRMRIICGGQPLDLTAHEYKLLIVLMKHPQRVFTRDQLLTRAWEDPGAVTDRTVDAHVKALRAKLRACSQGAEDRIQTRRGIGYLYAP